MSEQEIIEGNKLIAKFMQYDDVDCHNCKYSRDCNWIQCGLTSEEKDEQLKYHSSFDWLMPVVEKIEKEYWVTTTTRKGVSGVSIHQPKRMYEKIARFDSDDKLEATWKVVVEFIKWYNSCQKENI